MPSIPMTEKSGGDGTSSSRVMPSSSGRVILVSDTLPFAFLGCPADASQPLSLSSSDSPRRGGRRSRNGSISSRDNMQAAPSLESIKGELPVIEQKKSHVAASIMSQLGGDKVVVGRPSGCSALLSGDEAVQSAIRKTLGPGYTPVFTENGQQVLATRYCQILLRPILHYSSWDFNQEALCETRLWSAYQRVNEEFCRAIISIYKPGDIIWILDYQLALLPAMLRAKLDSVPIAFYLRAPFPTSELFRCIPEAKELLLGMLGANVIGFQTYSYARHFLSSCTRILGCESSGLIIDNFGVPVSVVVKPMGVDMQPFALLSSSPTVTELFCNYQQLFAGKKIVLGVETSDQIRGIIHKLKAFDLFLQLYPECVGSVALVQVIYGAAGEEDTKCDPKMTELVASINGTYGSLDFHPVHLYQHALATDEYFALLSLADILLMTSERDSVNSILLEYIACQSAQHGVPIFSEFIGLADVLPSPFRVNPWDHRETAATLHEVLSLTREERATEWDLLRQFIHTNSTQHFVRYFMEEINLSSSTCLSVYSPTPMLGFESILESFCSSSNRLICLDYDGTLTPIHKVPSAASPSQELMRLLRLLTGDSRNQVYIISGRDQSTLEEWLGNIPRLGMSAEHGCFLRPIQEDQGEAPKWMSVINTDDLSWKGDVKQIMDFYTERTPGSLVEVKNASLTWHYRLSDPEFGSWQSKGLQSHLELTIASKYPVEVISGKKNLEVRPKSSNKGEIVRKLLERHGRPGIVFCAGDDRTDEDMFRALLEEFPADSPLGSSCFTCCIGAPSRKTVAKYRFNTPDQVISLLLRLSTFSAERSLGVTL